MWQLLIAYHLPFPHNNKWDICAPRMHLWSQVLCALSCNYLHNANKALAVFLLYYLVMCLQVCRYKLLMRHCIMLCCSWWLLLLFCCCYSSAVIQLLLFCCCYSSAVILLLLFCCCYSCVIILLSSFLCCYSCVLIPYCSWRLLLLFCSCICKNMNGICSLNLFICHWILTPNEVLLMTSAIEW